MCEKHYRRYWRATNKEHNRQYAKEYHEKVRKPVLEHLKKPKEKVCKQCNSMFKRTGTNQNFCTTQCRSKFDYLKDKDQILMQKAVYYQLNKNKINHHKKLYKRKRRQDPVIRFIDNLRSRLNKALSGNYKAGSAIKDLGCSIEQLKIHLESKFYTNPKTGEAMAWDNYGLKGWHIDHIKPLNSYDLTDPSQFKEACNYTNLQPLWALDNLVKSNKT